jgi:hypothetical protein
MSSRLPGEILLGDPLSKETRTERRSLLGASAIGIVIVKTGLVPSKISALGIEFNQTDQRSLLLAIAAVVLYFLTAFLIYAGSDFLVWRLTIRNALKNRFAQRLKSGTHELEQELGKRFRGHAFLFAMSTPMSVLRGIFEFGLPIVISIYAVILLIRARV